MLEGSAGEGKRRMGRARTTDFPHTYTMLSLQHLTSTPLEITAWKFQQDIYQPAVPFPTIFVTCLHLGAGSSTSGAEGEGVVHGPTSSCLDRPTKVHVNQHRHSERNLNRFSTPTSPHSHLAQWQQLLQCAQFLKFLKFVVGPQSHHKFLPHMDNPSSFVLLPSASEVVTSFRQQPQLSNWLPPSVCSHFPPCRC